MNNGLKIGIGAIIFVVFAVFGYKGCFVSPEQPRRHAKNNLIKKNGGRFYTRSSSSMTNKSEKSNYRIISIGEPITGLLD